MSNLTQITKPNDKILIWSDFCIWMNTKFRFNILKIPLVTSSITLLIVFSHYHHNFKLSTHVQRGHNFLFISRILKQMTTLLVGSVMFINSHCKQLWFQCEYFYSLYTNLLPRLPDSRCLLKPSGASRWEDILVHHGYLH